MQFSFQIRCFPLFVSLAVFALFSAQSARKERAVCRAWGTVSCRKRFKTCPERELGNAVKTQAAAANPQTLRPKSYFGCLSLWAEMVCFMGAKGTSSLKFLYLTQMSIIISTWSFPLNYKQPIRIGNLIVTGLKTEKINSVLQHFGISLYPPWDLKTVGPRFSIFV